MKLNILTHEHIRGELRRNLAEEIGFARALLRVAFLPNDVVEDHFARAMAKCGVAAVPAAVLEPAAADEAGAVGAAFDGHILKAIIEWAKSPQGKAILSLLVTALSLLLMFA